MKTKRILLITGICIMTELGLAQNHLPPVFGNDTTNIRHDEISQLYLSPRKVVWTSSESSVSTPRAVSYTHLRAHESTAQIKRRAIGNG